MSIKIYIKNSLNNEQKLFNFTLTEKIIDIKKKILNEINNGNYDYIDLENITEKIYKDYGKLFFDKGLLPLTNDNYKLGDFTIIDETRIYTFVAYPKKIDKIIQNKELKPDQNNINNKNTNNNIYHKIDPSKYVDKNNRNKNMKDEFIFREEDFPPLK